LYFITLREKGKMFKILFVVLAAYLVHDKWPEFFGHERSDETRSEQPLEIAIDLKVKIGSDQSPIEFEYSNMSDASAQIAQDQDPVNRAVSSPSGRGAYPAPYGGGDGHVSTDPRINPVHSLQARRSVISEAHMRFRALVPAHASPISVTIPAHLGGTWLIEAWGSASHQSYNGFPEWHGPDGMSHPSNSYECAPGALGGTYRGQAFCIGSRSEVQLDGGELVFLWLSDDNRSDNVGSYDVMFTYLGQ
jgi:hypothetical protein